MPTSIEELAETLVTLLIEHNKLISIAESCTGGWVAKTLTDIAGSSKVFESGFVTYSNQAKVDLLGVSAETLERTGAVSEATVKEMALGALGQSGADFAVSISGVAGPGGGSEDKPVGTVCFGWAARNTDVRTETRHFQGDRAAVRYQSVQHCLQTCITIIQDHYY